MFYWQSFEKCNASKERISGQLRARRPFRTKPFVALPLSTILGRALLPVAKKHLKSQFFDPRVIEIVV